MGGTTSEADGREVSPEEFAAAMPLLLSWGMDPKVAQNPGATFRTIDRDGGGH